MSGIITPILDTLLHEVLGKRVETQVNRDVLEPVKPLSTGHAPRAIHSDSRLNAEQTAAPRQSGVGVAATSQPSQPSSLAPASTHTHFSAAARSIADILVKFPAPPSVVISSAPLVAASETADPSQLSSRLRQSIETSGLFYEAHLARWHRGEISRSLLEREPQMQLFVQRHQGGLPMVPEGQGRSLIGSQGSDSIGGQQGRAQPQALAPLVYSPSSSAASTTQSPLLPMQPGGMQPAQGQAFAQPGDAVPDAPRMAATNGSELADDALLSIVRHQLELMVTPTLRWEGDLWSGVFMALAIQVPEIMERHGKRDGEKADQDNGEEEAVWHSELTLSLPSLGTLGVNFWLQGASLKMTLACDDEASVATLRAEGSNLEARLNSCGLADVKVSILPKQDTFENKDS